MKKHWMTTMALAVAIAVTFAFDAQAQYGRTKTGPDASQPAKASQTIGVDTEITISYHRPGVKGREVWGTRLANYGGRPWRAGANETTTVTFSKDVLVNGEKVAAGTYGFHIALSESDWYLVFNKNHETWGSFAYKEDDDVLRVKVTPQDAPHQEWLLYGFEDLEASACSAFMHWEKKKASVKIAVAE